MVVSHHPLDLTLAEFAAGRLDEARSVVIATHAVTCPACAERIGDFEAIGGMILSHEVDPVPVATDALERVLARANTDATVWIPEKPSASAVPEHNLPLSHYLKSGLDDVKWRPVAPGISQSVIEAEGYRRGVLRLLKITPGTRMLKHSHRGGELTLILRGAYRDELGEFVAGDLADLDSHHTHEPMATGDEDCICLIATSAPLEFKTLLGKVAQPFVGL